MIFISICIPAYNRANVLPELLDSILNQNFDRFEIVVCEDFSPERTAIRQIVLGYSQRFGDKVKYFENPKNLGYDANLRRLIELSTGDYVLFMGNDDLLAPNALIEVAKALTEQKNIGVVLRSYSSFIDDPNNPVQVFRYFSEDRLFPPCAKTIVTFFRRAVFISGMIFKRSLAVDFSTDKFDGTLLYQQYLLGRILACESGLYLNFILSYHRLGGVPDFGVSNIEKELFIPREQTPKSSINFIKGMIRIASSLDVDNGIEVKKQILRDIGNYSYPILSIQAERPIGIFIGYAWRLMKLGLWSNPLFYVYLLSLLVLGRRNCDLLIIKIKQLIGRTPQIGNIYAGNVRSINDK